MQRKIFSAFFAVIACNFCGFYDFHPSFLFVILNTYILVPCLFLVHKKAENASSSQK